LLGLAGFQGRLKFGRCLLADLKYLLIKRLTIKSACFEDGVPLSARRIPMAGDVNLEEAGSSYSTCDATLLKRVSKCPARFSG
jgi:hypothetical protein